MTHDGAIKFKEVAERLSGGKLEVQVFGGAQLGGERDLLEGIRLGTVYMAVGTGALANFAPAYNVVQLPILIKNQEHMTKIAEGPAGKLLAQRIEEQGEALCSRRPRTGSPTASTRISTAR
jgi:TRAP-type C4-dicarboxylate transport system substrate-binding protein